MLSVQTTTMLCHTMSQLAYHWLSPALIHEICHKNNLSVERLDGENLVKITQKEWFDAIDCLSSMSSNDPSEQNWDRWKLFIKNHSKNIVHQLTAHIKRCYERQGYCIDYFDPYYPSLLRMIPDPPLMLSCLGSKGLIDYPSVAIIGARKASLFSQKMSFRLGEIFSQNGYVVISGGAFGCDISSHRGVLSTKNTPAPAIIVFAGGLETLYPKHHDYLFQKLYQNGALFLSERLWTVTPRPYDFPVRNRIISGLAQEVYLIQAGKKSGAMVTAQYALDQGRELWVLNQAQGDVRTLGNHNLISSGATPFDLQEIEKQYDNA